MSLKYFISRLISKVCFSKSLGTKFFLRRYFDTDFLLKNDPYTGEKPLEKNYIWTMWLQDEMPELCEMCIDSIKKFYPEAIVITEKNLRDYVDLPEIIWEKYKSGILKPVFLSDLVRLSLLDKYGGTWIDATCYMTQKLPEYILKSSFFVMKDIQACGNSIRYSKGNKFSSFFVHSAPNNYLCKCIKNYLLEYWKAEDIAITYFFLHFFVTKFIRYDKKFREEWEKIPLGSNALPYLMYSVLYNDYDKDLFEWLKSVNAFHKLTYKTVDKAKDNPNCLYNHLINEYRKARM